MLTTNFTPFPALTTERLLLRDVKSSDAEHVLSMRSDPQMMQYIDRPLMTGLDAANIWIEIIKSNQLANDSINWMISFPDDNEAIGNICFWHLDKENYRAEIGYMLATHHHGKGLMQEAIAAVISYGFKEMGLHSIEANVNPANYASIKALERNGFVREGCFKEKYFYNGKFLDSAVYSLLADDMRKQV